jgi:pimeloyl-ACP methyl ester carboxylesterase
MSERQRANDGHGLPTLVLVHGAFHGPWCFERVRPLLAAQGIESVAPELPLGELAGDVAVVREALDVVDGPVVLLGHSFGGAVVTEAGTHPAVQALVYLAAVAPDVGESTGTAGPEIGEGHIVSTLRVDDAGRTFVDPAEAAALFYPDAAPADAAAWASRLRSGSSAGMTAAVSTAAWRDRPSHYVVCVDDPIVPEAVQRRLAARAGSVVHDIPGDHSPFLARPRELAGILAAIVTEVGAASRA